MNERNFWTANFEPSRAGKNLSWGAVFAGAVTFIAVFIVLSLITSALGFGFISFTDPKPLSGVGVSTGIWTVITLIISFFASGFVAGLSARRTGLLHGFLAWAMAVLMLVAFTIWSLSSVLGAAGTIAARGVDVATDAAGQVASTAGSAISASVDSAQASISENFQDIDTEELQADVADILGDTDIPELQPDYISGLIDDSINDVENAAKEILVNPENAEQTIDQLTDNLGARAEEVADAADRDAIANAVEENTDLTGEEADEAVDNIYTGLSQATDELSIQLENAQKSIDQATTELSKTIDQGIDQAKETGDDVTSTISAGSVIIFIGLLIGLLISSYAGRLGSDKVKHTLLED